jgi:hypothetical protein
VIGPLSVVQVVEDGAVRSAAWALVECGSAVEGEIAVADRPATGIDGAGLGRSVELELVVGDDASGTTEAISEDAILEVECERVRGTASTLQRKVSKLNVSRSRRHYLGNITFLNVDNGDLELVQGGDASFGDRVRWNGP